MSSISSVARRFGIASGALHSSHHLSCSPNSSGVRCHQSGPISQPPGPFSVASIAAATSQKNAPFGVIEALHMFCTQQASRSGNHCSSGMPSSPRVTISVWWVPGPLWSFSSCSPNVSWIVSKCS